MQLLSQYDWRSIDPTTIVQNHFLRLWLLHVERCRAMTVHRKPLQGYIPWGMLAQFCHSIRNFSHVNVSYENFRACQDSTLHDVEAVSLVTLFDNDLTSLLLDVLHRIQNYAKLLRVQTGEHEWLLQPLFEGISHHLCLYMLRWNKLLLLVPYAEYLSADWGTRCFSYWWNNRLGQLFDYFFLFWWIRVTFFGGIFKINCFLDILNIFEWEI